MEPIKINGKTFRPVVHSTFEHDIYLMNHIRGAGIDQIQPVDGEPYEDYALRLFDGLIGSGRLFSILGGLMLPEDVNDLEWTPEAAKETASFLMKVSDPADKVAIERQVVALLVNFIQSGIIRSRTSRKSSIPAEAQDTENAESSTMGTGAA